MKERFLPIGTVVLLNGGTKKVMITGFCSVAEDSPDKMWDYRGCPYPEGVLASEGVALFDHGQIKENYINSSVYIYVSVNNRKCRL